LQKSSFTWPAAITVAVLIVPLIGNILSAEVNWSAGDFLVGGLLVFGFSCFEFFLWKRLSGVYRRWVFVVLLFAFLLLWAELAVGIFGSPIGGS